MSLATIAAAARDRAGGKTYTALLTLGSASAGAAVTALGTGNLPAGIASGVLAVLAFAAYEFL